MLKFVGDALSSQMPISLERAGGLILAVTNSGSRKGTSKLADHQRQNPGKRMLLP